MAMLPSRREIKKLGAKRVVGKRYKSFLNAKKVASQLQGCIGIVEVKKGENLYFRLLNVEPSQKGEAVRRYMESNSVTTRAYQIDNPRRAKLTFHLRSISPKEGFSSDDTPPAAETAPPDPNKDTPEVKLLEILKSAASIDELDAEDLKIDGLETCKEQYDALTKADPITDELVADMKECLEKEVAKTLPNTSEDDSITEEEPEDSDADEEVEEEDESDSIEIKMGRENTFMEFDAQTTFDDLIEFVKADEDFDTGFLGLREVFGYTNYNIYKGPSRLDRSKKILANAGVEANDAIRVQVDNSFVYGGTGASVLCVCCSIIMIILIVVAVVMM